MARLNPRDVREILQMLEDGINLVPKLDRLQKMRLRSKVRRLVTWLAGLNNPTADIIYRGLEGKISEVFSAYPYGYRDKIKKLLEQKTAGLRPV
jgi:hypothetical protein